MSDSPRARRPHLIRVEVSIKTLITVPLIAAAIWVFVRLWPVAVIVLMALMLAATLNPLVEWLEQRRLRRGPALAIVFVLCALTLVGLGLVSIPALWSQLSRLVENLPAFQEGLATELSERRATRSLAGAVRHFHVQSVATAGVLSSAAALSFTAIEIMGYGATAVILAIYLLADHERMRGALYAVVPRRFHLRLARMLLNVGTIVAHYIRGQIITSVAIAAFTFALLALLRVPNALALATFAGLTDVVPFVGGFLGTAPAVFATLAARGTGISLIVLVAMLAYQELESRVLVPWIYGSALRLPSVAVVVALLAGTQLGGLLGAFLALPVAAALLMAVQELRLELPGDDTDDRALRARDEKAEDTYASRSNGASPEDAAKVALQIADSIQEAETLKANDSTPVPITGGKESC